MTKTDGRAGRDVEKLSRRSQRTHRKLGCRGMRDLGLVEVSYPKEFQPVKMEKQRETYYVLLSLFEAREALGGADVGEVVDEGAPDPFAGRVTPVPGAVSTSRLGCVKCFW